jgi:hypothetical protein
MELIVLMQIKPKKGQVGSFDLDIELVLDVSLEKN